MASINHYDPVVASVLRKDQDPAHGRRQVPSDIARLSFPFARPAALRRTVTRDSVAQFDKSRGDIRAQQWNSVGGISRRGITTDFTRSYRDLHPRRVSKNDLLFPRLAFAADPTWRKKPTASDAP